MGLLQTIIYPKEQSHNLFFLFGQKLWEYMANAKKKKRKEQERNGAKFPLRASKNVPPFSWGRMNKTLYMAHSVKQDYFESDCVQAICRKAIFKHRCNLQKKKKMVRQFIQFIPPFNLCLQQADTPNLGKGGWAKKTSLEHTTPQPLLYYSQKAWGRRDNSRGRRLSHGASDGD